MVFVAVDGADAGDVAAASVDKVAMAVADGDDMASMVIRVVVAVDDILLVDRDGDLRGLRVGIASRVRDAGKKMRHGGLMHAGQLPSSVPTHLAICRYLSFRCVSFTP